MDVLRFHVTAHERLAVFSQRIGHGRSSAREGITPVRPDRRSRRGTLARAKSRGARMGDIDSAGVYFLSVEEFESRKPAPDDEDAAKRDAPDSENQSDVDATKSAITRPSSSPQSS
jgi:hypothetical protein